MPKDVYQPCEYLITPEQYRAVLVEPFPEKNLTNLRLHHIHNILQNIGGFVRKTSHHPELGLPQYQPETWQAAERTQFIEFMASYFADLLNFYVVILKGDNKPPVSFQSGAVLGRASKEHAEDYLGTMGLRLFPFFRSQLELIFALVITPAEIQISLNQQPDEICFNCQSTEVGQPGYHCQFPPDPNYINGDERTFLTIKRMVERTDIDWPFDISKVKVDPTKKQVTLPISIFRSEAFLRWYIAYYNHWLWYGSTEASTRKPALETSDTFFGKAL
jgi:hypothetical protein